MVSESKIDVYSLTWNAVVLSRVGNLAVLAVVSVAVDILEPCQFVRRELVAVFLLPLDLVVLEEAFVVDSVELLEVEASEAEAFEEVIEISVEAVEALVIKEEVALAEEVGMEVVLLMATVMAQLHPLMLLLVLAEEAASVAGTAVHRRMAQTVQVHPVGMEVSQDEVITTTDHPTVEVVVVEDMVTVLEALREATGSR